MGFMEKLGSKVTLERQKLLPVVPIVKAEKITVPLPLLVDELFKIFDIYYKGKSFWEEIDGLYTAEEIETEVTKWGFDPAEQSTIDLVKEIKSLWDNVYAMKERDGDRAVWDSPYDGRGRIDILGIVESSGKTLKFVRPLNKALFWAEAVRAEALRKRKEDFDIATDYQAVDEVARTAMPMLPTSAVDEQNPMRTLELVGMTLQEAHTLQVSVMALAKYIVQHS